MFLRTATSGAAYPDDFAPVRLRFATTRPAGALEFFNSDFYKYASPDGLPRKCYFAGFAPLTFMRIE